MLGWVRGLWRGRGLRFWSRPPLPAPTLGQVQRPSVELISPIRTVELVSPVRTVELI